MLVQALRLHAAEGTRGGVGWLFALADRQISAAIRCMHDDPAHRWTLQELAERAGMSRSIFALRFRATVGVTPMEHLTRWRMLLAGDRAAIPVVRIAEIAFAAVKIGMHGHRLRRVQAVDLGVRLGPVLFASPLWRPIQGRATRQRAPLRGLAGREKLGTAARSSVLLTDRSAG